jgi:hypothetical protein
MPSLQIATLAQHPQNLELEAAHSARSCHGQVETERRLTSQVLNVDAQ